MTEQAYPILYTFRRCPYAMRARMALAASATTCAVREVVLRDKPAHMVEISPKATVPVLQLQDGTVLEESLEIMYWALSNNDPNGWLSAAPSKTRELIEQCDVDFKHHLDRYKYATRYAGDTDPMFHRTEATRFLLILEDRLENTPYLMGGALSLADIAIFPFIRQFANTDADWFASQPLPRLQAWLKDRVTSDLFSTIMKKWPAWKKGDEEPLFPTT